MQISIKRVFVAVWIPDEIKKSLLELQNSLKKLRAQVSWVRPTGMHLTLRFFGDSTPAQITNITQACQKVAPVKKPFQVCFKSLGCFPNPKRARVIWIGLGSGASELSELSSSLEKEFFGYGFEAEKRPFKPHLTLGRVKSLSDPDELQKKLLENHEYLTESFTVKGFSLIQSQLERTGAIYTELESFSFL